MPRLIEADEAQVRAVMEESWSIWGAGLDLDAYQAFWKELRRTDWARRRLRHMVWADDDGTVLSSVKIYRPDVNWMGTEGRCSVYGAVFTPAGRRGLGHAGAMLRAALSDSRRRGDAFALLFSDIDPDYYEALGFRSLPAEEATGSLGRPTGNPPSPADGWVLRPMGPSDFEFVRRVHREAMAGLPLALDRSVEHWRFLWKRAESFFRRLDGTGLEERYTIVLEAGRPAGYLIAVEGGREWHLREAGVVGNSDDRLGAALRAGALAARSRGRRTVVGWLPRRLGRVVPEWKLTWKARSRAIPMVRPLSDALRVDALLDAGAGYIPYLDQF